jgi:hypothetical protein
MKLDPPPNVASTAIPNTSDTKLPGKGRSGYEYGVSPNPSTAPPDIIVSLSLYHDVFTNISIPVAPKFIDRNPLPPQTITPVPVPAPAAGIEMSLGDAYLALPPVPTITPNVHTVMVPQWTNQWHVPPHTVTQITTPFGHHIFGMRMRVRFHSSSLPVP